VRLSGGSPVLRYEFVATDADADTRQVRFALRTPGGHLVWQDARSVDAYGPVTGAIDIRRDIRERIVPGTYIFFMRYGATTRERKILILG
jgi:hypothetical protein